MSVADSRETWRKVFEGQARLTWGLWADDLRNSELLTDVGREVMLDTVRDIEDFLGEGWLEVHRAHVRPELVEVPFMSMRWWPSNDTVHVHRRILEFALRLRLLKRAEVPGLGVVRRNMKRDLGHFAHSYVQLEVAALALRAGWAVRLEPPPAGAGGARVDLLLTRAGQAMAVEVKTFNVDELMRADIISTDAIQGRLLGMSAERQVQFDGDLEVPDTVEDRAALAAWLDRLGDVAATVQATGEAVTVQPPMGGQLRVVPDVAAKQCQLRMPIRSRDPLARLLGEIERKAEQGRGGAPLWLRFNETRWFFHQLISEHEDRRVSTRDSLVRVLERNLMLYPHVAGLILSSEPIGISDHEVDATVRLPGAATAVVRTTQYPWFRSTMVMLGPARAAASGQKQAWLSWYRGEGDWLDWALVEAGLPRAWDLHSS